MTIFSKVSQTEKRQISYDITYMWNLKENRKKKKKKRKQDTNELAKQKQTQTWKTNLWLPKGRAGEDIN